MHRTITIFLSNVTEVSANWTLNYVKFPKKQTVSKYTTTQWEEENLTKLDDPEVFEFSEATVSITILYSDSYYMYRECLKESQHRSGRSQRDYMCPQCQRMSMRSNSSPRKSSSTSE